MAKVGDKIDGAEPGWSNISFDNSSITYTGMTKGVSYAYGSGSTASYSFTFTGTAIRIITGLFSDGATNAQIKIDNTVEYADFKGTRVDPHIVYEKTKLPYGTHTITVRANGSGTLSLRAIHYAAFANQGDKLEKPELGWQRHKFNEKLNDGTEAIKYYPENIWKSFQEKYMYATSKNAGYIRFKFYGSAIRIISTHFTDSPTNAKITIDGKTSYYNSRGNSDADENRLSFEWLELPLGIHTVEINPNNSGTLSLSAIDLKDGEYLVPLITVGDVLTQPEPGWKRFDDSHNSIKYDGAWLIDTGNQSHNSTLHYKQKGTSTGPAAIKFSFYGSKLRILGLSYYYYDTDAKIIIDGHEETINFNLTGSKSIYQCLLYEKKGLSLGNHTVQIQGIFMNLDAIDVDADGYLLAKVGDVLKEPQPGWKRFDDTDSNIEYVGNTWQSETSTSLGYYKNTLHYKHSNLGSEAIKIQFGFIGSCLRIIALSMSSYDRYATIKIDDKPYNLSYYNKEPTKQCLIFEELNLEYGSHTVSIEGLYLNLDAIDIDADGSLFTPAKVGDILTQPEPGWKRFDDSHSSIMYAGVWGIDKGLKNYNSTLHYKEKSTNTEPAAIKFNFYGSKLRIIGLSYDYYDTDAKIIIDGHEETINFNLSGTKSIYQCLLYEKKGLLLGNHTVQIQGVYMTLDAIDIDADGYLITPVKIGDVLKEPESGWKRFDDRDPNIIYQGNWIENENITTHYRGTFHNKPSSSGDDSIVRALFDFSGTKVRIIAFMTTGSYDVGTIKIDGEAFNFSYIKGTPTAQCLVFEKAGLEPGIHKVELSGRYINLDAIDIDETGELIPIEIKKPKVSLYEKESGKVFVDDFDSINPKWLMSPFTAFNNVVKPGFLRMNHSADKDVLLLIDKPQGNVAIQVIADYTPTKEGDKGGLLIYKNEANNIEFLESMKVSDSPDPKEWMAVCKENQWDFYNKTDITFDYVHSEQLDAHKIGVVLKKGNTEGFTPLDINKIIITTSNLLRLRQLYEKYKVVLKNAAEDVISTSFVEAANTGIDIPLPSLEFEGIVEIYDEDGTLVAKRQTTFFGGDMYCMGSSLHISMDTKELDETDPTHLGYMTETERLVKMTLTNDNVGPVSNVKVAIQQYMEKFGYTWAHLSLDGSHYTNELAIETLNTGSSKDFWVKIIKDVNYMAFEPIYFNIHLSHE
ncbi:TPA: protein containing cell adhesion domain protein [Bacillus paranthracis]